MDAEIAAVDPPRHCWLNPKIEWRESPIQGMGLFATDTIREGERILSLGGRVISGDELAELNGPYSSVGLGAGRRLLVDPAEPVRYGNHSCDPNTWMDSDLSSVARRDIQPGEEVTVDYATQTTVDWWSMSCNCGTPGCRKVVRGSDWRFPELQEAYGQHWNAELRRRIEQARRRG